MYDEHRKFLQSLVTVWKKRVVNGDYSGIKTPQFESYGSKFINCRFDSMQIGCAVFASGMLPSTYINCTFDGIRIKRVLGGLVRFRNCTFKDVTISGWSLRACDLVNCVFTGKMKSGRYGGSFWGAPLPFDSEYRKKKKNRFRGNDFSNCALIGMDFRRGVDLRLQKLPSGSDYLYVEDGRRAVDNALKILETWEDEKQRKSAQIVLELLHKKIDDGQKQIFISNVSGGKVQGPIWSQLCEILSVKE